MIGYLAYRAGPAAFGRDGFDVVGLSLILVAVAVIWLLRWFILAAAAVGVLVRLVVWIVRGYRADRARLRATRDAVASRADEQHGWTSVGDERGTYGQYPPAAVLGDNAEWV